MSDTPADVTVEWMAVTHHPTFGDRYVFEIVNEDGTRLLLMTKIPSAPQGETLEQFTQAVTENKTVLIATFAPSLDADNARSACVALNAATQFWNSISEETEPSES